MPSRLSARLGRGGLQSRQALGLLLTQLGQRCHGMSPGLPFGALIIIGPNDEASKQSVEQPQQR